MYMTNLLTDNSVRKVIKKKGFFSVVEYEKDFSVDFDSAQREFFASSMNYRKRQLVAELDDEGIIVQAGAMQLIIGDIAVSTNTNKFKDLIKKVASGVVTDESIIKPYYTGSGLIALEPFYRHILLEDVSDWDDGLVSEDGMFLACEDTVDIGVSGRNTISSVLFGKEGLFNPVFSGEGVVALESPVPEDEIIVVDVKDDVLRVDGSMAIAWSSNLKFTVQKVTTTLVGSVVSGEGLVNVFEGTGRVLLAPVREDRLLSKE